MAWNEPGGNNQDPWNRPQGQKGPPDLDELLKKLSRRFGGFKGGGGGSGKAGGVAFGMVLAAAVVVWLLSGIYIVNDGERGVVLEFGKYAETTMPGPHWHFPAPIATVEVVDVAQFRSTQHKAQMLTGDENIVQVDMAVQYTVRDPAKYLFNVREPDLTMNQVSESALREVVGKSEMEYVLTQGRAEIAARVEKLMQEILDSYDTGLVIRSVNLQDTQPPEEVQGAFEDAIKAREDKQRYINEAEAYANDIIPRARGEALKIVEEARGYKARVINSAQGEAQRFIDLLAEYRKAPEVTRERLYIDTVQEVLSNSSKVLMGVEGGNNLTYLPLDRIIGQGTVGANPPQSNRDSGGSRGGSDTTADRSASGASSRTPTSRSRIDFRSREVR